MPCSWSPSSGPKGWEARAWRSSLPCWRPAALTLTELICNWSHTFQLMLMGWYWDEDHWCPHAVIFHVWVGKNGLIVDNGAKGGGIHVGYQKWKAYETKTFPFPITLNPCNLLMIPLICWHAFPLPHDTLCLESSPHTSWICSPWMPFNEQMP